MELDMVTMDRDAARRAFLEYRREVAAVRTRELTEAERRIAEADTAIMAGYKILMRGRQVLRLSTTLGLGGYDEREVAPPSWASTREVGVLRLPRLAIMRADAEFAWTRGVRSDGSVTFTDEPGVPSHWVRKRRTVGSGTFPEYDVRWAHDDYIARVPHVPPNLRPNGSLARYDVLWEAEWKRKNPPAPRDPALLRLIGGDLYAVVAVWELTDLERTVLGGVR